MRDNDWGISNYPMVPGHEVCSGEFCSEMNLPELFIRLSFNSIAKYYLILTNDGTSSFLLNHWPGSPDASSSDQTAGCRQSRQNRFRRPPAPGRPLAPTITNTPFLADFLARRETRAAAEAPVPDPRRAGGGPSRRHLDPGQLQRLPG